MLECNAIAVLNFIPEGIDTSRIEMIDGDKYSDEWMEAVKLTQELNLSCTLDFKFEKPEVCEEYLKVCHGLTDEELDKYLERVKRILRIPRLPREETLKFAAKIAEENGCIPKYTTYYTLVENNYITKGFTPYLVYLTVMCDNFNFVKTMLDVLHILEREEVTLDWDDREVQDRFRDAFEQYGDFLKSDDDLHPKTYFDVSRAYFKRIFGVDFKEHLRLIDESELSAELTKEERQTVERIITYGTKNNDQTYFALMKVSEVLKRVKERKGYHLRLGTNTQDSP